jgi:uncharacterized protein (DUF488 family)
MEQERTPLFTIGHSTRPLDDLIAVLKHYGIELLVDIRHYPNSRKNPQFNKDLLEHSLPAAGIAYQWMESLGGFRAGGYAAYMETPEFSRGFDQLVHSAAEKKTAILCAEVLWFKCHRRFVADRLSERGFHVVHISDEKRVQEHNPDRRQRKTSCEQPPRTG